MAWRFRNGFRKLSRTSLFLAIFLLVFSIEFLVYYLKSWTWERLYCPSSSHCISLLFVADPQILGEINEQNSITIWDNDRYLHQTFSLALSSSKPDAIIFLGDLMDEGSLADDNEFERYVDRFFSIFPADPSTKILYLPGDNDIGGENGEPILPSVVQRFRNVFQKKSELLVGSCHILKVNPVVEPMPHPDLSPMPEKFIRIAVSHFPLLGMSTPFTNKVLKDFQPHVVFSAHSHVSCLRGPTMKGPSPLQGKLGPVPLLSPKFSMEADIDEFADLHEIVVPTCSYRMGVHDMGFGHALIDETRKELQYVVLWLPDRLVHLHIYLVVLVISGLLLLWWFLCAYGRSRSQTTLHSFP